VITVSRVLIDKLETERGEQFAFMDNLMAQVQAAGRDLVPAEEDNLRGARERVAKIDAQLVPLREWESLRAASSTGNPLPAGPRTTSTQVTEPPVYATAGAYVVDHLRAHGVPWAGQRPDPSAAARLERAAITNVITTDVPGLLPKPVVGAVTGTLDLSRPLVTSVGAKDMGGIPGSSFSRPHITQHTAVGKQAAQKTVLASQPLKVEGIDFTKETYGGTVDVARQVIDWTSPSAWDALIADLAGVYGAQTEMAAAASLVTAVTQATAPVATDDLAGWAAGLYEAAMLAFMGGAAPGAMPLGKMPDRIWVSLDMWAKLGSIVDANRMSTFANVQGALGSGDLSTLAGDILNVQRIVVWAFPPQTVIVGNSTMFEFYEEVIGLLSAVEPSLLGVEVAYGGYVAYAPIDADAFAKVTPPVVVP
jgi:hypothetical protein